ncbi:hypothetical protein Trichorick_01438 (plasmid) [Candidatus Trichorickettsia mobilis]|uniref:Uncharacterized protein n=1 Tax=Candidatus Trichorickettsia mobilis TaxID=1346319 RepID=A0ABZ0UWG0_9RICK|nr:hypothetical protein [Candidatus Trichorickettsia mobilis]WPY01525.1 hypothetical protein Trichorick_01438 [Candidatus Trichorickettsia mobilis]
MTNEVEKEAINSLNIAQNIVRYAQALNADATIYWGTTDQNLANTERKAILVSDLKILKSQIEIIDRLLI